MLLQLGEITHRTNLRIVNITLKLVPEKEPIQKRTIEFCYYKFRQFHINSLLIYNFISLLILFRLHLLLNLLDLQLFLYFSSEYFFLNDIFFMLRLGFFFLLHIRNCTLQSINNIIKTRYFGDTNKTF